MVLRAGCWGGWYDDQLGFPALVVPSRAAGSGVGQAARLPWHTVTHGAVPCHPSQLGVHPLPGMAGDRSALGKGDHCFKTHQRLAGDIWWQMKWFVSSLGTQSDQKGQNCDGFCSHHWDEAEPSPVPALGICPGSSCCPGTHQADSGQAGPFSGSWSN